MPVGSQVPLGAGDGNNLPQQHRPVPIAAAMAACQIFLRYLPLILPVRTNRLTAS